MRGMSVVGECTNRAMNEMKDYMQGQGVLAVNARLLNAIANM